MVWFCRYDKARIGRLGTVRFCRSGGSRFDLFRCGSAMQVLGGKARTVGSGRAMQAGYGLAGRGRVLQVRRGKERSCEDGSGEVWQELKHN